MLTFYSNPMSSNSQKVQYFLEETGIPCQSRLVDLRKGDQTRPEYHAVNPFEAVPAIELNGFRLSESNTILRYLAQRYQRTDWYPHSLEMQARVDQAMDFVTQHFNRWVSALNWYTVVAPMLRLPGNPAACEEAHTQLQKWLPRFERFMAGTGNYLVGPQPTIADAAFVPLAAQAKKLALPLGDFPLVSSYVERMIARPAWKKLEGEMAKAFAGK